MIEKCLAWLVATITGAVFFLYGNNPVHRDWLIILVTLLVADLVFGALDKVGTGTFSRRILFDGFRRKIYELFIIAIAHMLDQLNILQGTINLQQAATGFLIGYEMISVLDKIKISGVPIPKIITDTAKKVLGKYDEDGGGGGGLAA